MMSCLAELRRNLVMHFWHGLQRQQACAGVNVLACSRILRQASACSKQKRASCIRFADCVIRSRHLFWAVSLARGLDFTIGPLGTLSARLPLTNLPSNFLHLLGNIMELDILLLIQQGLRWASHTSKSYHLQAARLVCCFSVENVLLWCSMRCLSGNLPRTSKKGMDLGQIGWRHAQHGPMQSIYGLEADPGACHAIDMLSWELWLRNGAGH